ncbi:unnamed protein product [Timema podura]|uniref:Uncharacterized protein n=1 Tax=Timema podura TaxID=61482 RepID=A0ABN7NG16_TIMPD|nr:unnamed protein product [Timema podura]
MLLIQTTPSNWLDYQGSALRFVPVTSPFSGIETPRLIEKRVESSGDLSLCTFLQKDSGIFEIVLDGETLILSGRILLPENKEEEFNKTDTVSSENAFNLTASEVYNEMENRGYQYKDHFRGILNAQASEQGGKQFFLTMTGQPAGLDLYSVNRLFPALSDPHRGNGSSVSLGEYYLSLFL